MNARRGALSLLTASFLMAAGCEHSGSDGGSKWFNNQSKAKGATGFKPVTPLKPAKSPKVKGSRGLSPLQPTRLQPARGPSPVKPMKLQPMRGPTPLKPLSLQPTRVQPNKHQKVTLGQPAQKPKNLWEWLATDPNINQPPAQREDSWFHNWFKVSKGQR